MSGEWKHLQRRKAEVRVTDANASIVKGPAIHPSRDMLHAKDSTPEPITAVMICANAVHTLPDRSNILLLLPNYPQRLTTSLHHIKIRNRLVCVDQFHSISHWHQLAFSANQPERSGRKKKISLFSTNKPLFFLFHSDGNNWTAKQREPIKTINQGMSMAYTNHM